MSLRRMIVSFIFTDLLHVVFRNDGVAAASCYHHTQQQRRQAFFRESKKVRLNDHVLQILDVASDITCAHHCLAFHLAKTQCQSFNYQNEGSSSSRCELNNSTIEDNPENAAKDEKFSYFYRLKDLTENVAVDYVFQSLRKPTNTTPQALGVGSGSIPDTAMTASSIFSSSYQPYYARLNQNRGSCSWTPSALQPPTMPTWHQVDLGLIKTVTAVGSQGGCIHLEWVKTYAISYSPDDAKWIDYKENCAKKIFTGNTDQSSVVTNFFQPPITARFMRIYPQSHSVYASLRIEYYGY